MSQTIIQGGGRFELQPAGADCACPACGSLNVEVGYGEISDQAIVHACHCKDCRLVYEQVDEITFWYHAVVDDNDDLHTVDRQTCAKVVIEVYGGVADVTSKPDDVDVEIIDHDNEGGT